MDNQPGWSRLEWLQALRQAAEDTIERIEVGLPLLSAEGDEHMRNVIEAWLEQQRTLAAKLERRIKFEEPPGG